MGLFDKMKEKSEAKAEKERIAKEERMKEFEGAWYPGEAFDFDAELPYSNDEGELVEAYQAKPKDFALGGSIVSFSEEFDRFNELANRAARWADTYSEKLASKLQEEVYDLPTLWQNLGPIYMDVLYAPMKMGHQTLIVNDIWDISFEQFYRASIEKANLVKQASDSLQDNINHLAVKNYERVNSENLTTNKYRDAFVDGFMAKQASKGVGAASVVSLLESTGVTDVIKSAQRKSVDEEAKAITVDQCSALYSRMCELDYVGWVSFLMKAQIVFYETITMLAILDDAGFKMDASFMQNGERVKIMLSNLSESVPKDKVRDVLIKALVANPYDPLVWEYINANFGETDETKAISDYLNLSSQTKRLLVDQEYLENQIKLKSGARQARLEAKE